MHPTKWVEIAAFAALVGCGSPAHDTEPDVTVSLPPPEAASAPPPKAPAEVRHELSRSVAAYAACVAELRSATKLQGEAGFALYQDGLAAERAGKIDDARRAYLKLIQDSPKSRLVPFAYFGFGVNFQKDAAGDPSKWDFAIQSYQEVIKYPDTSIAAVAHLELGRSNAGKGEDQEALAAFKHAVDRAKSGADGMCGPSVIEESKGGMVKSFAKVGAPDRAYTFFRVTYDDPEHVVALLARAYREVKDPKSAGIALYDALTVRITDELCSEVGELENDTKQGSTVRAKEMCAKR